MMVVICSLCSEWIFLNKTGIIADNIQQMKNYCGFIEVYKDRYINVLIISKILDRGGLDKQIQLSEILPSIKTIAIFKIRLK